MAVHAHAVALDAPEDAVTADPARNAAIWFAPDGYDPAKGVNGRRMAGDSFLRGWFRHAEVAEWLALTHGPTDAQVFRDLAGSARPDIPARVERLENARAIAPVGSLFISGPNFATEAWRRSQWGATAYAICGITHTISTKAVMEGLWHLRAAPQAEWDAIICTSRAVRAAVGLQMDLIDDFLSQRFGGVLPPRPQLPVIPLGVDCDAFQPDPAAGLALRAELGIPAGDCVALIVARLSPHEKFDPLPVYLALQRAQAGAGRRLHLILYGDFPDGYSRRVFLDPARNVMPDVALHHLPHRDAARRLAALSAAEMFLFPIDNLQESFGIAPVEAMAAGLPVVASDWDGIRDTVADGTGFRIPTTGARPEHVTVPGQRYHGGTDNYIQYLSQVSAVTRIDVGLMAQAVRRLMTDGDLRAAMGAAGRARARALFDWKVVVPVMQDLFADLDARRRHADPARHPPLPAAGLPVAPSPMALFQAFPTVQLSKTARYRWTGRNSLPVVQMMALRDYPATKRIFETPETVEAVGAALSARDAATAAELAAALGRAPSQVERCLLWLMKYDYAETEDT
ncbi:glycosyltransferase family 4 protein [Paragemmobacter ruber]|uniref:Glycosyltransferase n=1 Tax=Paragemmobacter ruber TaxID=1985673 RepID=A0ABW9YAY2_9RHOB|nr:glycosyltransferase family 4 protein [Rhodobacter ruber]NBE08929.1 glycosyltransferase [Rhodobacter ruber]